MHQPENPHNTLEHAALLLEARVAVTPMNGQIRFGGTMELASHQDKINMKKGRRNHPIHPQIFYPILRLNP